MCAETIYIPLLEEGTEVFRPTKARKLGDLTYEVLKPDDYNPEDENWEYPPGSLVKCELQVRDGKEILIAVGIKE